MRTRKALLALGIALACNCPSALAEQTYSGTLRATVADDFAAGESTVHYRLQRKGESIPLVPTEPTGAMTGDRVTVEGAIEDGRLVGSVVQTSDAPEAPVEETRTIAFVFVKWASTPESELEWWDTDDGDTLRELKNISDFYREESDGKLIFTGMNRPDGDIYGWYTLKGTPDGCPFANWTSEAEEIVDFSGYDHVVLVTSRDVKPYQCNAVALAYLGGRDSWTFVGPSAMALIHEIGHNLGLWHANGLRCRNEAGEEEPIADFCTSIEYADQYDAMGFANTRHNHGGYLNQLGLLEPSNIVTVTESGIYSLTSAFPPTDQPTLLRIPHMSHLNEGMTDWYTLEIRKGTKTSAESEFEWVGLNGDDSTTGVTLRVANTVTTQSFLIDSTPGPIWWDDDPKSSSFIDASFKVGDVFDDGSIRIEPLEVGEGKALVSIEIGDVFAPEPPHLKSVGRTPAGFELKWDASQDDVGVSHYGVFRNSVPIGTTPGLSLVDPSPPAGLQTYTVRAKDGSGKWSDPSNTISYRVRYAPSAPVLKLGADTGPGIELEWKASAYDLPVSYVVFRNDLMVGGTTGLSFRDPVPPAGPQTYTVRGKDGEGNQSAASNAVKVTVPVGQPPRQGGAGLSSAQTGGSKEQLETSRPESRPGAKLRLSWRGSRGKLIFVATDSAIPTGARLELWIDGKLVKAVRGPLLKFTWKRRPVGRGPLRVLVKETAAGELLARRQIRVPR